MHQSKYTKMIDNNNQTQYIEPDRVKRFLNQGWHIVDQDEKMSQDTPKVKLTASPTVITKKKSSKKTNEIQIEDEVLYDIEDSESNFSSVDYNNNHKEEN